MFLLENHIASHQVLMKTRAVSWRKDLRLSWRDRLVYFSRKGPQDAKIHKRDFTQSKQNETHTKPRACSRKLPRPNHGRNFVVKCGGGQLGVKPI